MTRQPQRVGGFASTWLGLYLSLNATGVSSGELTRLSATGRTHGRNTETCVRFKVEPGEREPKVSARFCLLSIGHN